ncbi:transcription elongation factor GreA [bacterium]|nr:transcription elongation factor GreA [candidate division CSSED10-310 bacterium]
MKHPLIDQVKTQMKKYMFELTVEIPKQLEYAISLGDLSENAEYEMTKERQLFVESRIAQLEKLLNQIQTINLDDLPTDRIAYGSRVTIADLDLEETRTYIIVLDGEDPPYKQPGDILVTVGSPIARSLFGRHEGDEVQVRLPKGVYEWEIVEVIPFSELNKNT